MKYLLLLTAVLLISCDGPNDPVPIANTEKSFKNPQTIGTLPDGRPVKLIIRYLGAGGGGRHYIYFVDGETTATTNRTVKQGKTSHTQVVVEIDGVKYAPIEEPKQK